MKEVKIFYESTPFNYEEDNTFFIQNIKNTNQVLEYRDLHKLLRNKFIFNSGKKVNSIIEFGCGTGWLSNSLAFHYKKNVIGVDFTKKALNKAKQISSDMNLNSKFKLSNIFDYSDKKKYDLVLSLGVLHHTKDCKEAFKAISKFVKPGGYLYIGLYHLYGRRPMLRFMKSYAKWHGNKSAFNLFKKMRKEINSDQNNYSWFRDQVLHPYETQHTLIEVNEWLNEISFKLQSTSINNYKSLKRYDLSFLDKLERGLEAKSFKDNVEDLSFNPGYFTICARNQNS